jgi:hypothetical protein
MPPSAQVALVISIVASALGALVMCLLVARYGLTPAADEDTASATRRVLLTRFGHALAGVCFAATGIMTVVALATPREAPPAEKPAAIVVPDRAAEARLQALAAEVKALAGRLDQAEARVAAVDSMTRRLGDDLASVNAQARQMERALSAAPRRGAPEQTATSREATGTGSELAKEPPRVSERVVPRPRVIAPDVPAAAPPALQPSPDPAAAPRPSSPAARVPEPAAPPRTSPPAARATEPTVAPPPAVVRLVAPPPPTAAARPTPEAPTRSADGGAAASKPDDGLTDKLREDWKTIRGGFATAGDDFKAAVRDLGRKLWR